MKRFKLLFLDAGLVHRACRVDLANLFHEDPLLINRGAIAEQFVGQELLSLFQPTEPSQLFYWEREKVGSSAEVDFVHPVDSLRVPIEVKAGKTGRLKSLKIMMEEKKLPMGVRISSAPLSLEDGILTIPLYMIHELHRLVRRYAP